MTRQVRPAAVGWPQLFALLLLAGYVLQCLWVIHRLPLRRAEAAYAQAGLDQFAGKLLPRDSGALPIPAAVAGTPVVIVRPLHALSPDRLKWVLRLPFVAVGWLLGASIWYVARRLYGNAGGYIALTLYCFSTAVYFPWPGPLLTGSLGVFGTIFVAIAAAHTLYAPAQRGLGELRSRWRRILLLGISIALAIGSGYWGLLLVGLGLLFMLYLVPERRGASASIVAGGCVCAAVLLLACFGFHPRAFAAAIAQAQFLPFQRGMISSEVLRAYVTGISHGENPILLLLLLAAVSLIAYFTWSRCRYFGNTAPLLSLAVLTALGLVSFADVFVGPFPFRSTPFLYVFIGGIFADLLESRWRTTVLVAIVGLLAIYALSSVLVLARLRPGIVY